MSGRRDAMSERIDLEKEFPQVGDVRGTLEVNSSFGGSQSTVAEFTKMDLPYGQVSCVSPVCTDGGVSLGDIFRYKFTDMVRYKKERDSVSQFCRGYEDMGRGQRKPCKWLYVRIDIQVTYRDSDRGEDH